MKNNLDMRKTTQLTDTQRTLIDWFNLEMTDEELKEFNLILARYYGNKITRAVDKVFEEKGWGEEKIKEWQNEHMRTPYKATTENFFISIEELEDKFYKNRSPKLTNAQLKILKYFQFEKSEKEVLEMKDLLVKNYAERIVENIDKILITNRLKQEKAVQV